MLAATAIPTSVPAEVQQAKSVKGNVVDENGEPMIGVTIKVVGSTGGTITDMDGNFSLNVPSGRKLQFTYAGYKEQHPDYRSGENYYEANRIAAQNAGQWSSPTDDLNLFSSNAAYAAYKAGIWTDFDEELQKSTTWSNRHTITLSGGNDKTSARFSIGYANDGNKWKKSGGTDRYTLRANIDHKIHQWIDAGVNFQLTHRRTENSPYQSTPTTGMQLGSPYGYYDDANDIYKIGTEMVERPLTATEYVNPLINTLGDNLYARESYGTNVVANGYLDIHPIDGLNFRTQVNAHLVNTSVGDYADANSASVIDAGTNQSTANMTKSSSTYIEWNNILTYQFKMLPEDHHLSLTLLTTWNKRIGDNLSATSINQTLASNLWWNLASNDGGDGHSTHSSAYTQQQNFSYAGRISYDWKSRYLFTASLRRDGASVLADGHKWDTFPSAALAWRVSDEPFMKSTKSWLDDLKIRATYGVTGNSGISVYGTESGVEFANWSFGFQDTAANRYTLGIYNSTGEGYYLIGNKDTKWEKSKTFDLGFDIVLFNNRLSLTFDYYNTKTTDLILLRSLPTSSGNDGKFATYTNIGSTRNRGVELTINSRNIVTKDFQWNSTLSFSANSEKIIDLVDGTDIQIGTNKETSTLMLGRPIKSYKTFKYLGIWSTAEAAAAQIINSEIRNARVVKPGHSLAEAQVAAGDMTVEWILEERARELCGEWLRWFDLKRTGKLVSYIRQHNPAWDGNDVVDEHNNLWPIPNTFLDKLQNAEEFGQNPGYDPYVRNQ